MLNSSYSRWIIGCYLICLVVQIFVFYYQSSVIEILEKSRSYREQRRENKKPMDNLNAATKSVNGQKRTNHSMESLDLDMVDNLPVEKPILRIHNEVYLRNFKFCKQLENISIHKVPLRNAGLSYTASDAVSRIEDSAKAYYHQLKGKYRNILSHSAKRYACYMAAVGNVAGVPKRLSEKEFVKNVDKRHYFPTLSFDKKNTSYFYPEEKKIQAKMAYLILIHAPDTDFHFKNIEALVLSVTSPISVVMLHVDKCSDLIKKRLHEWATQRRAQYKQNIFIVTQSEQVVWGTGSMIFAQLKGFFELLDVADWEYVVNLSDTDYAIRSPEYVYNYLSKTPGRLWIKHWQDKETESSRVYRSILMSRKSEPFFLNGARRFSSQLNKYRFHKASQWMILPRDFISHLRSDQSTVNLLAWIEYSWVPDEFFFPAVALLKSGKWEKRVVNTNKRYISPFKGLHPDWISDASIPELERLSLKDEIFYVRKLQISNYPKVKLFLDQERAKFDKKQSRH